ncbi:alcohol dehydrogenase-like 1 protein [Tanacetum coccineum]
MDSIYNNLNPCIFYLQRHGTHDPGCHYLQSCGDHRTGRPITVEEVKVDLPKASEVRIKMLCASICHTDILFCNGPLFLCIYGHEGVGMVESVGKDVSPQVKLEDLVIPLFICGCGQCSNCKSGITNFCNVYPMGMNGIMFDGTLRMSIVDPKMALPHASFLSCGFTTGLGETWKEAPVPIGASVTVFGLGDVGLGVDPKMALPHASFLSCGFTTGLGATWKEAPVPSGASVIVFGLGDVGLGVIKGAQMQGALKVIGVDVNEKRQKKARCLV